jgi:HD superfamily phosphodiesterase
VTAFDAIWKRARADFIVPSGAAGRTNLVLWERAERVARLAQRIAAFPELRSERIDSNALLAAALYQDAGWIVQLRRGEIDVAAIRLRPTTDAHRELGAALLQDSLRDLLADASLVIAANALRESGRKSPRGNEARIVSDAANLDDIGPQAVCRMLMRQVAEGGGLSAVLHAWDRQCEYRFWQARIDDCLAFETSRRLARQRLAVMETFMAELRRCHEGEDAAELATEPMPVGGREGTAPPRSR